MALDDASTALMSQTAAAGRPPMHQRPVAESRALAGAMTPLLDQGPAMAREFDETISVEGAEIAARVLVPQGPPRGVIVYLHGGAWVVGTLEGFQPVGRRLADRSSCVVVLVDYRLAPEHPFPTPVDDAEAAMTWVAENREHLGCDGDASIVMAGDSAGGNLAAAVANRLRHVTGSARPIMQVLIYPVLDADFDRPSYLEPSNQLLFTRADAVWMWDLYVPDPTVRISPDAAPLRAPDLTGSIPAVVVVAEHDVLRDEGEAYAERLREVGALVAYERFDGQMHGFFTMPGLLPGSAVALDFVAAQIDGALASRHESLTTPVHHA
jgi:acetyl esterase